MLTNVSIETGNNPVFFVATLDIIAGQHNKADFRNKV